MPPKKIRAIATPGSTVATQRYQLYRMAHGRISEAVDAGFYLEAITLIESIATDRLESRLTFLTKTNVGFKNLGPLIQDIRTHETDSTLKAIVDVDLDRWRVMRNEAVHEMAKLEAGDTSKWDDRVQVLVIVVEEGLAVLKSLKNRLSVLRRAGL
jgi:hypothetical protein